MKREFIKEEYKNVSKYAGDILWAVVTNGNRVIDYDKEVDVKYLFFFKNGKVGTIITREVTFRNAHICDIDYMHTIFLKDDKPYLGEQLDGIWHIECVDVTARIYNQSIKRLSPYREGYLIDKYVELKYTKITTDIEDKRVE